MVKGHEGYARPASTVVGHKKNLDRCITTEGSGDWSAESTIVGFRSLSLESTFGH